MDDYKLLADLHKRAKRQGPGGEAETKRAVALAALDTAAPLKIADIGCGTGSSAILLANTLNAQITAVDFLPDFINVLKSKADIESLDKKIDPLLCSMDALPFNDEEFDVIWSEGAIYNIGFKKGINDWKRFLKPGGILVVSEITWITDEKPIEIQRHWEAEYPEIDTASSKMSHLEKAGYSPMAYFILPEHCWLDNYYQPLESSFPEFLARNYNSEEAKAIVEAERKEITLYRKYCTYYSYGVYIARKLA